MRGCKWVWQKHCVWWCDPSQKKIADQGACAWDQLQYRETFLLAIYRRRRWWFFFFFFQIKLEKMEAESTVLFPSFCCTLESPEELRTVFWCLSCTLYQEIRMCRVGAKPQSFKNFPRWFQFAVKCENHS